MEITRVKCQHLTNPLGFAMEKPSFSFVVRDSEAQNLVEASVKISLCESMDAPVFGATWTEVKAPYILEANFLPEPRTRYYYQISAISDAGETAASAVQWFETGYREEAWTAPWIMTDAGYSHPVFARKIIPLKKVKQARLYICGLGLFEAVLGRVRLGDEYMTPYCNNYHAFLQRITYDITEFMDAPKTLRVTLAPGWYAGRFGFKPDRLEGYYGNQLTFTAEIRLLYEDGEEKVIRSDDSWTVTQSTITFSNIYDGEYADETVPAGEPKSARVNPDSKRLSGLLKDRVSPPVHVMNRVNVKEIIHTPAGETVLDLGQNLTGIFELKMGVPAGTRVHLQFGEILQEGNFFRDNLRSAKAEYWYVSDGKHRVISPRFTFYGYRYVKVEGIENIQKRDFTALVLHSDLEQTGEMVTGNPLINRLLKNVLWGQKGNFLDVPTDCPQRDERMGWTGDAEVFCPTASYWMDTYAFYEKYLTDMNTEQQENHGAVPHVIPSFGFTGSACAWADAATIIPWKVYEFTGDQQILRDHYEGMKAWIDYVKDLEENQDHAWEKQFHYGDWLALDNTKDPKSSLGGTDEGFLAEMYYYYSTLLTEKAAKVLGKRKDRKELEQRKEQIRTYIQDKYYTPNGECTIDTQTAHIMSLFLGFGLPKLEKASLERLLQESGGKLKTGFIGTPLLCTTLSDMGRYDLAYNLLFNEEYPGWLYEVKNGATTIWERWNSVLEDGRLSDLTMNSLNHYAYGSIAFWIWAYSAGIRPVEGAPGFSRIVYNPVVDRRMNWMKASYESASGLYESEWRILPSGKIKVALTIPVGCKAKVEIPYANAGRIHTTLNKNNHKELGAGHYEGYFWYKE